MLILTRKPGESLYIGDNLKVTIVEIKGNQIRVGIDAPPEYKIYREEIFLEIQRQNMEAAKAGTTHEALDQLSGSWKGASKTGSGDSRITGSRRMAVGNQASKQRSVDVTVKGKGTSAGNSEPEAVNSPANERGKGS
jgi:carbon storage regulator